MAAAAASVTSPGPTSVMVDNNLLQQILREQQEARRENEELRRDNASLKERVKLLEMQCSSNEVVRKENDFLKMQTAKAQGTCNETLGLPETDVILLRSRIKSISESSQRELEALKQSRNKDTAEIAALQVTCERLKAQNDAANAIIQAKEVEIQRLMGENAEFIRLQTEITENQVTQVRSVKNWNKLQVASGFGAGCLTGSRIGPIYSFACESPTKTAVVAIGVIFVVVLGMR